MGKLTTPNWVKEGFDSKADWEKTQGINKKKISGKIFKLKKCPKCKSTEISIVLVGEEGKRADNWECKKCKWKGRNVLVEEVGEEEFLEALEK